MYLISEIAYEYNDEIYHTGETEGLRPITVYSDKAKADSECAKANLDRIRDEHGSFGSYGYDIDDVFRIGVLAKVAHTLNVEFDADVSRDDFDLVEEAFFKLLDAAKTQDDITLVLNALKIKFFKVSEVEFKE